MHRLKVADALKLAAEAGIKNDHAGGRNLLQSVIDTINHESPKDVFSQKYVEIYTV